MNDRPANPPTDPRTRGGLWRLTAGPLVWAIHFLASYVTAAVWCARMMPAASLGDARTALFAYTAVALALVALLGWRGWQRHRAGRQPPPHDDATAGDRHRFLGLATALLCGLSFVAVAYTALGAVMIGTCR